MGDQIPHGIDVVADRTEVAPTGVQIVDVADIAACDPSPHRLDTGVVQEGVPDAECHTSGSRR